jgi:hypothetical protein
MFAAQIGRNDPCPCGSAQKYKKCCLRRDGQANESPAQRWHDLDGRLATELGQYALRRFGAAWEEVMEDYPIEMEDEPAHAGLFVCWALYERKLEGRPIVDWFLEDRGRNLVADERQWLEAQRRAWLSVLEVTDVVPGSTVGVHDLLTGRRHSVTEVTGSKTISRHDLVLGRVVEHDGHALFAGLHPNSLPPLQGPDLVAEVREELGLPKPAEPLRMKEDGTATVLVSIWQEGVDELASRPRPRLTNTAGDELAWTTDVFSFTSSTARGEVEKRLATEPDIEGPAPGQKKRAYTFLHQPEGDVPPTVLGSARVLAKELRVESNSRARADALRARLESLCAGLVRHRRRATKDMDELLAEARPAPRRAPPMAGPEVDALLLEVKGRHYATWTREPLPALDGLTAREAATNPRYRSRLAALLKDMERSEEDSPPGQRFDFGAIRAELGIGS